MGPTATGAVTGVAALRLHGPSGNDYRAERNAKVNVMVYTDGSVNLRLFNVGDGTDLLVEIPRSLKLGRRFVARVFPA